MKNQYIKATRSVIFGKLMLNPFLRIFIALLIIGSSPRQALAQPSCTITAANPDSDGDGIADSCDLDSDNDGILDIDEGRFTCANSVTTSINTVPYPLNTLRNTSTTNTPVTINNLAKNTFNLTASLVGSATWTAGSGTAGTSNYSGGIQIKNNFPAVGDYIYLQPSNATSTSNYALYRMDFPYKTDGFQFISAGLNSNDTYEIYAFNGSTPIPLTSLNLSNFSPALGTAGTWTVTSVGNGIKVTNAVSSGGTSVESNYFQTNISGELTRVEIRSYKNDGSTSTVTTGITSLVYCSDVFPKDTDGDGIPDYLDLDSDGDGCADAIEGGSDIATSSLVTSSMPGGNAGGSYTGTFAGAVVQNLGNTVSNATGTLGVPTIAGTGQTIGSSQNGAVSACIIPVSGSVFNDVDGDRVTDAGEANVSGGAASSGGSVTTGGALWANLIGTDGKVLQSVQVSNAGTYSLNAPISTNGLKILLTGTSGTAGQDPPASTLPTGWVNTGEPDGVGNGATQTANPAGLGSIELNTGTAALTGQNFAIQRLPTATGGSTTQTNPGGNAQLSVPTNLFTSTDTNGGTVTSIRLTTFPSGVASIVINGSTYTSAGGGGTSTWPAEGITIAAPGGVPAQVITVDPSDEGAGTVNIPFVAIDNAGSESAVSASATINLTAFGNAFACQDQVSYLTRNGNVDVTILPYTLYSTNLISGVQTSLGAVTVGGSDVAVNGIGYNTVDNFIWGSEYGTGNILKISANGTALRYPVTGLPAANYMAGDVDGAGNLYLYVPSATTIYKINVNGTLPLTASTITVLAASLPDFAVNADGTKIYGVSSSSGDLITYTVSGTTSTRALTDIGSAAFTSNTFLDSRNNLFLQSNSSSSVYLVDPTDVTIGNQRMVYNGPTTVINNSDGAHCRTASVYSNAQQPFGCEPGVGYVLQSNNIDYSGNPAVGSCSVAGNEDLFMVSIQNGTYTEFYPNLTSDLTYGVLNNMGYNPTDGFLWAYRAGSNQLVRIGKDKTVQFFPIDGLPGACNADYYSSGDIDENGIFYLMNGLTPGVIRKVDLNPASSTYLSYLGSVTITGLSGLSDLTDVGVNPIDGLLYGVSNSRNLIRINPADGTGTNLGQTGVAGTTNIVIAFMDLSGNLYVQASGSTNVYRIPFTQNQTGTPLPTATLVKSNAPTTGAGDGASCPLNALAGVQLSGNVWNDTNGDRVKDEGNTVTDVVSETLTVYLTDAAGNIIGKTDVLGDGSWTLPLVSPGTYTVHLSNDATLELGTNTAIPTTLPGSAWEHTGTNFNNTPGTPGSSSATLVVAAAAIDNVNFGIQKRPIAGNGTSAGSNQSGTLPVNVPLETFNTPNPSSDVIPGTVTSIAITAIPTGATSITVDGTKYGGDGISIPAGGIIILTDVTGLPIPATTITVDPIDEGATTVTIPFVAIDNAGARSINTGQQGTAVLDLAAPAVQYTISGTVFLDPDGAFNGANGGVVNGVASGLHANLYDASGVFVATAPVQTNGTYSLSAPAGTGYQLQLSAAAANSSSTFAPNAALPGTLKNVSTSETPSQADGVITLNVTGDSTGNNFGIQRPPVAGSGSNTTANLGGLLQVAVPGNTFTNIGASSDPDGNVASIRITSFPTNTTSIVINGISYTSGNWPVGGVTIPTTASGSPVWPISADPSFDEESSVTISFIAIDNAGSASNNTGTAVLNFTFPPISVTGTVFNDVDGNKAIAPAGEAGSTVGVPLYAYLVNSSGTVVSSDDVETSTGAYTLLAGRDQDYTIELSSVQYPIGTHVNITPINNNLPPAWVNVVEKGNNTPGDLGDGNPDGVLAVTVAATDITNQNFGVADKCNPVASGLPDSDGDGVTDVCDLDDDNDGIPDTDENPCVSFDVVYQDYTAGLLTMLKPSMFGIAAPEDEGSVRSGSPQLIGRDLTADISHLFGYGAQGAPGTAGKVIVSITNANIHPTSDAFYVRGDLSETKWKITGSLASVLALDHGRQFYSGQKRTFDIKTHEAAFVSQSNTPPDWTSGVVANDYYVQHLKDYGNNAGFASDGTLFVGVLDFAPKNFSVHTNDVGLSHWSTYFVQIKPECDTDMDGIPNRLDLDSDGDGCFDAIEGTGNFKSTNLDNDGRLTGTVNSSGQPAGTPQGVGSSQNNAVQNCTASLTGSIFNDNNGTTDNANGTTVNGTSSGLDLVVNLYDAAGNFVASAPVQSNGTYTFPNVPLNTGYQVQLNTATNVGEVGENISANPTDLPGTFEHVSSSDNVTPGNGISIVDVTGNVTGVNFGINEPPTAVAISQASQTNPGGTTSVPVTNGFSGTDPNSGAVVSLTITEFPDNATSITVGTITYYPTSGDIPGGCGAACAVFPSEGILVTTVAGVPTQAISVDPVDGGVTVPIPFTVTDNAGLVSGEATLNVEFTTAAVYSISGNVLNDGNGNTDLTVSKNGDGSAVIDGTAFEEEKLYVTLVGPGNTAITTVQVQADGTYTFPNVPSGTYSVVLSAIQAGTTSANSPLPGGWDNTGEQLGTATNGADGAPNGILPAVVVGTQNVSDANFGINKKPEVTPETANPVVNQGGSVLSPVTFPTGEGYSGTDLEDGVSPSLLAGKTVTLVPGTGGDLYYDYGNGPVQITASTAIPDFDPVKVSVDPTAPSGATSVTFTYAIADAAGVPSEPATVTVPVTAAVYTVSGKVYTDADGATNGAADGEEFNGTATSIFANLYNSSGAFVASVQVGENGVYTFADIPAGTGYQVQLSKDAATTGSTNAANAPLPGTFGNVSANGDSDGDLTDGVITFSVSGANISGLDFGIQEPPVADPILNGPSDNGDFSSTPPTGFSVVDGFLSIPYASLKPFIGEDPEDGELDPDTETVKIGTVNDNTKLYYNFPVGGVREVSEGEEIPNFDPSKLVFYGQIGSGNNGTPFGFTYQLRDAANVLSEPALYTFSTSSPLPVTLLSFNAKKSESNSVTLNWATTEESNSEKFEVEHSTNGKNWNVIGIVAAKGDSKQLNRYSHTHTTPNLGDNLYRLKMIDQVADRNDASFAYSRIVSVDFASGDAIVVYPNPATDKVGIKTVLSNVAAIKIYNANGTLVASPRISSEIDVSQLQTGSYTISITEKDGTLRNVKFVIVK